MPSASRPAGPKRPSSRASVGRGEPKACERPFPAVVEAYHPDAAMRAREAGLFSMDEPLLLRCIREAPRVSTLEPARLLVPGVGPLRLEAGVLSSLERLAERLR